MGEVEGWLTRLAGWGLPGSAPPERMPASVEEVVTAAGREGLLGVLAAAADPLGLEPAARGAVADAHVAAMQEVLLLEERLLEIVAVLDAAAVEHRVLKGSALAHLAHPDPAQRSFGDIDLAVRADQIDTAVDALVGAGGRRLVPAVSVDFDRRFAKSVTLRWREGVEVDLHRTLAAGPFGFLIPLDDLWAEPLPLVLAGRRLHTLGMDHHLLHGAIHVALGDVTSRLGNRRDVALLARHPDVDPERVIATAERWGCGAPVARGLAAAAALGHDPTPLERWGTDRPITRREQRRLAVYGRRAGRYRRQAVASLAVLGWRDRVAFIAALAGRRAAAPAP